MVRTREARITYAIEEAGMKPSAVAKGCHVSVQSVHGWMSGKTKNVKLENFFKLAAVTGFEARWIALGQGPERSPYSNRHIASVVALMVTMPEAVRAEAKKQVERLSYFAIRLMQQPSPLPPTEQYPDDRRLLEDRRVLLDRRVKVDRRLQMPDGTHKKEDDTLRMPAVNDPGPPTGSKPPPKASPRGSAGKRKK